MRRLILTMSLLALAGAPRLSASLCITDSLANYLTLSGGCSLGEFTLQGFTYTQLSGSVTIPASSITVTPLISGNQRSLTFSSGSFNLSSPDTSVYLLGYTWDPGDIRSFEDILNANSPVFPGFATIDTSLCENSAFTGSFCPNAVDPLQVTDNGMSATLTDTAVFSSGLSIVGVRDQITLDASAGGSSEIASFGNLVVVPEPSALFVAPLAAGWMWLRSRRTLFRNRRVGTGS
jgi:hypothetical protein